MTGSMLWGQGPGLVLVVSCLAQSLAGKTIGMCRMNEVGARVTSQSHQDTTAACVSYRKQRTKGRESLRGRNKNTKRNTEENKNEHLFNSSFESMCFHVSLKPPCLRSQTTRTWLSLVGLPEAVRVWVSVHAT